MSVASLLDVQEAKDKSGKLYYKYEILTRTGELNFGSFLSKTARCVSWVSWGSQIWAYLLLAA